MNGMWKSFEELSPLTFCPATKGRLIRCYKVPLQADKREFKNLECLFHDDEGVKFHFTVQKNAISQFESLFHDGETYGLRNFVATHNIVKPRLISHRYKALILSTTKVRVENDENFPTQNFSFKSFQEIAAMDVAQAIPFGKQRKLCSQTLCIVIAEFSLLKLFLFQTLNIVESINQFMVSLNQNEGKQYMSSDSMCKSDSSSSLFQDIHTPEFLNSLKCSGVPNHELYLKVGTPVMLLRNIDHSNGLCNGTRLVITRLGSHILEDKVIIGQNAGNKVLIPRMSLTSADPRLPFKFQRKQFPLLISYAMTINKISRSIVIPCWFIFEETSI